MLAEKKRFRDVLVTAVGYVKVGNPSFNSEGLGLVQYLMGVNFSLLVYPYLKLFGRKYGFEFAPSEMRWGIGK